MKHVQKKNKRVMKKTSFIVALLLAANVLFGVGPISNWLTKFSRSSPVLPTVSEDGPSERPINVEALTLQPNLLMNYFLLVQGKFCNIVVCLDCSTGNLCASKEFQLPGGRNNSVVKSIAHQEYYLQSSLSHPNVLATYGMIENEFAVKLLLEYCPMGDLYSVVSKRYFKLKRRDSLKLLQHILLGLEHIHERGIAHLDIKPENVLIGSDGNLKICDFGYSSQFRRGNSSLLCEKLHGTLPFLAPELAFCPYYDGIKADIWSVGVTYLFLRSARVPWKSSLTDILPTPSRDFEMKVNDGRASQCYLEYARNVSKFTDTNFERFVKYGSLPFGSPFMSSGELDFVRKMINLNPSDRYNATQLLNDEWFQRKLSCSK